jgi:hypothetical protein
MSKPHYEGPCSDCGRPVSTDPDGAREKARGGAYSCERARDAKFGAIYLLCSIDIARREISPDFAADDWAPGPKHNPSKVVLVEAVA